MDKLFLQIINMSITSSYVILFIIVVRLFLKKAPKIFSYGLWGIAFFRLIFPFSFESIFSLISINTKTIPENIAYTQTPQIQSGIRAVDGAVNRVLPPPVVGASVNPMQIWISIGSTLWIIGLVLLLLYSIFTTLRLSKNLKSATYFCDNIYKIETIKTPFVFGLVNPKIYLPNNLAKTEESYIIKHEETHINRKDHIIKFVAFLIVSIHWFNPIVWFAFYLMGEDMELSCDELVIKEMGYEIKRDYSNSLLSLSIGKRIIGGSPIAFGENNTKGRIKNILNYKKPKFWVIIAAIIVIIALAVGLLSNPLDKEKTVEDYALEYIDREIAMYENAEWGGLKIIDKEITKLEKLSSFDNILSSPIDLWILDYKLKPENPNEVILAGGLEIIDGWLIDFGITGKPHLTFTYDNENLICLGNANAIEFDLDTFASQEMAIRIMLENIGLLPNETYEGNHVVMKFPLSTGETSQLLLSQPVKQGNTGIWVVERWMDGNGTIYYEVPSYEEDIKIGDYYKSLQEQSKGYNKHLLDPIEVGYEYIINTLGQRLVKKDDLVVINPATMEDFLITPESHYIGYITKMSIDERIFHLDRVEFLTKEDEERAAELNIDINIDMPSGFYIYNKDTYPSSLDLSDETEYLLLDWKNLSKHKTVAKKEFIEYNNGLGYSPLYNVYTKDGYVTRIEEQYIP
ncbi:M56 family metallopeptidase [Clostridium sp. Cult2]|uniref:M56 family metallopeptidase n=1 Tax=Clostridium sp. Cult2 TaxID=2079003 RepID=UPI001F4619A0|nr:M56 family metallopeptidase [Clostridium sp. Cult2]MCF6466460.1 hypothetical protein [Clostridium sp. Cult2]